MTFREADLRLAPGTVMSCSAIMQLQVNALCIDWYLATHSQVSHRDSIVAVVLA